MSFLRNIISDLRQKRLWPVAAALLVALVAIPVLLSTSSSPAPAPTTPAVIGAAVTGGSAVPAVILSRSAQVSRLTGKARDPFTPQVTPTVATAATSTTASTATTSGASASTTNSTGSTASPGSTGSTTSTTTSTTTVVIPKTPPKPPVTGLSPSQSYHVAVSITNASGGFGRIDPLVRMGGVPSDKQPLLINLGVLKGGKRVLFALAPGTVVSGPGTCTPGPVDCEILALGLDQIEGLSMHTGTTVVPVAEFAVTTIDATQHPSVAAANRARGTVSASGRTLLAKWALPTLSPPPLFSYEPSVGAVVDQRDLTVGGG